MPRRTGASARTLALTRAQEAVALRDAERIKRERQLEATLADYYQAQGEVARIQKDAEAAAAPFEATICEAVRALDCLGETRAGIAGLTGLSLPCVRDYLSDTVPNESAPDAPTVEELARRGSRPDADTVGGQAPADTPVVRDGD